MTFFLPNLKAVDTTTVQYIGDFNSFSYMRKTAFANMSVTGSYSLMFAFTRACFDSSFLFDSLESICYNLTFKVLCNFFFVNGLLTAL